MITAGLPAVYFCLLLWYHRGMAGKKQLQPKAVKKKSGKKAQNAISGFSTLNQVAGVPKQREHHSSIPVESPKRIKEPHPICSYCGQEIENIAEAFTASDGGYVHFDCVISRIAETERLSADEKISYIGAGNFAVVSKNDNGGFTIVRTIPFESQDKTKAMKEYVNSLKEL